MRTTYAHNNLSAQSGQPIAVCCWKTFTFYKLFLVSSSPHWPRSARCDGVCLNICLLGISNRHIWNANGNGSGQTALCNLTRTFALNGLTYNSIISLQLCLCSILQTMQARRDVLLWSIWIYTVAYDSFIELITDSKLPIYGLIGIIYACLLLYLQTKLFVQSEHDRFGSMTEKRLLYWAVKTLTRRRMTKLVRWVYCAWTLLWLVWVSEFMHKFLGATHRVVIRSKLY